MQKHEILIVFFSHQYTKGSLFALYQQAALNTPDNLQEPIMEIIYRYLDKESGKLKKALSIDKKTALNKVLTIQIESE